MTDRKERIMVSFSYGQAYHQLPIAHTYLLEDELYIKTIICHEHARQRYEAGDGTGWKESMDALHQQILEHEIVIFKRQ